MLNKNGFTPKEAAFSIVLDHLYCAFYESTGHVEEFSTTPKGNPSVTFKAQLKKHIAELHNRLLDESDLEGTHLDPQG